MERYGQRCRRIHVDRCRLSTVATMHRLLFRSCRYRHRSACRSTYAPLLSISTCLNGKEVGNDVISVDNVSVMTMLSAADPARRVRHRDDVFDHRTRYGFRVGYAVKRIADEGRGLRDRQSCRGHGKAVLCIQDAITQGAAFGKYHVDTGRVGVAEVVCRVGAEACGPPASATIACRLTFAMSPLTRVTSACRRCRCQPRPSSMSSSTKA